ncbi:MAG: response regulator [Candidatus Paceibacterota bacterium]
MSDDTSNKSILIVDDDEFLVNMYATKFEKAGHAVETTTNSEQTLAKLREGYAPNIIVLDIIMPNIDGLELLEIIHKENLAPGAVIIMLTNQGGDEQIEKAKELGAVGYIVKATSIPSEVVEKVTAIAAKHGAQ